LFVVGEQHEAQWAARTRLLLVEADPQATTVIAKLLGDARAQRLVVVQAQHLDDVAQELLDSGAGCVLLDLAERAGDVLAPLKHLRVAAPDVPIIVLSDNPDEEFGLLALQAGAQDYLIKTELTPVLLSRAISYAIERKRSDVELAYQALHDPLTGLPNRVLFLDRLGVALHRLRRSNASLTVMFLDVDKFKLTNDSLGHAAGDRVLVAVAERLQELLRPADTMARFGGDEFTFLFEDLDSKRQAVRIVERLIRTAGLPIRLDGRETSIAVSIGIAIATDPATEPDALIHDADTAMYRAKAQGGSRFELFDDA
jgi:diguanylate cyclase (GGDEF)-like protein